MDQRAAAGRFRATAKRRLTVLLNVTEALFAAGDANRIERNELVALKDAFIHACDRYVETFTEDELTEEVNEQLSNYSSEQLQFYIRIVLLLLWFKAGAPRAEHYQLVRTLSADAVVTVL